MKNRIPCPIRPAQGGAAGLSGRGGFTLIELLIVVGIISILASIATPNFLEAQTRAKVSRVKNDSRVLALAIEAYAVDNTRYPRRSAAKSSFGWELQFGHCEARMRELKDLTTPIAYISTVPIDIFGRRREVGSGNPGCIGCSIVYENVLDYWSNEIVYPLTHSWKDPITGQTIPPGLPLATHKEPGYVIVSVGPDGSLGYAGQPVGCPMISQSDPAINSIYKTYDPTNGTVSLGNVFRLQSGAEPASVFYR
jgi:prepilin-type N-terminal cleavage/methylation domain-containing protein